MNFGLDYLGAKLTTKYDVYQFMNEASSPVINRETGDMINSTIPKNQHKIDTYGSISSVRAYAGGQLGLAPIVIREGLKVTRVDIKCDLEPPKGVTANDYGFKLRDRIDKFYEKAKRKVQYHYHRSVTPTGGIYFTHNFGGRESEKQIRLYTKTSPAGEVLRIEFQCRKELARSVWATIEKNIYNQDLLALAFFSLEAKLLTNNLLGLSYQGQITDLEREIENQFSDRKLWILTQVKQAVLKHFKETGEDLSLLLYQEVQAHFLGIADQNQKYDQLSQQAQRTIRLFLDN